MSRGASSWLVLLRIASECRCGLREGVWRAFTDGSARDPSVDACSPAISWLTCRHAPQSFSIVSFMTSITGSFGIAVRTEVCCRSARLTPHAVVLGRACVCVVASVSFCCLTSLTLRSRFRQFRSKSYGVQTSTEPRSLSDSRAQIWGWMIATVFTMAVAVSLAEICAAYPTSGV